MALDPNDPEGTVLPDRSQNSVHPDGCASSAQSVSDREHPARWAALYEQLLDLDDPEAIAHALKARPDGGEPERVDTGDPIDLITTAENVGEGRSEVAIVTQIRPDLMVIDLDRCTDLMLGTVLRAADDYAAQVAHLAASGSPDSVHIALACPSEVSRAAIMADIHAARLNHGLTNTECDIRTSPQPLRLPGSAPLKPGGGWCVPIDVDSHEPITPAAAAHRARIAVRCLPEAGLPGLTAAARSVTPPSAPGALGAPEHAPGAPEGASWGALDHVAPRAWRRRAPLTAQQWGLLHTTPAEGDRSHAATAAAWVCWQAGVRSWKIASSWYRTYPAFAKFAERADGGATHWQSIVERARAHRPPPDPDDTELIADVLDAISTWDDPELVAAAYAVVTHRFADGHGTTDRPIAWRDLAIWLTVSADTAGRRLQALMRRGLLRLSIPHDRATAPNAANCYTLCTPAPIYRTGLRHDVTEGGRGRTLLHPLWSTLGHAAARIWHLLSPTSSTPTPALAARLGLAPGTLSHGPRRLLAALEGLGLAVREGTGRGTRWRRGPQTLDAAADAAGVTDARLTLLRTINAERAAWHAPTVRSSRRVRERLKELVARAHHRKRDHVAGRSHQSEPVQLELPVVQHCTDRAPQHGTSTMTCTHDATPQPP
mgnify:FL=1